MYNVHHRRTRDLPRPERCFNTSLLFGYNFSPLNSFARFRDGTSTKWRSWMFTKKLCLDGDWTNVGWEKWICRLSAGSSHPSLRGSASLRPERARPSFLFLTIIPRTLRTLRRLKSRSAHVLRIKTWFQQNYTHCGTSIFVRIRRIYVSHLPKPWIGLLETWTWSILSATKPNVWMHWNLVSNEMWRSLRKQDGFRWKLYETKCLDAIKPPTSCNEVLLQLICDESLYQMQQKELFQQMKQIKKHKQAKLDSSRDWSSEKRRIGITQDLKWTQVYFWQNSPRYSCP